MPTHFNLGPQRRMPPQFRRRPPFDSADDEDDDDDEEDDDDEDADEEDDEDVDEESGRLGRGRRRRLQDGKNAEEANQINDELKYGAGHRSLDSNPVESQSEWSDDECREEATGELDFWMFYHDMVHLDMI